MFFLFLTQRGPWRWIWWLPLQIMLNFCLVSLGFIIIIIIFFNSSVQRVFNLFVSTLRPLGAEYC